MRDEKEERKKQARSNKQTRQSNTAHPRQSLFLEKMSCLGWDSNPRHCTCVLQSQSEPKKYTCICMYMYNVHDSTYYVHSTCRLTWHGGIIPEGEIWVKIGGDKGGNSVKISFQICNTSSPNSVQNTCVFSVFEARDTPVNLHIALDRYHEQIESLKNTTWRQVTIFIIKAW